jgi:hypothetical protein
MLKRCRRHAHHLIAHPIGFLLVVVAGHAHAVLRLDPWMKYVLRGLISNVTLQRR